MRIKISVGVLVPFTETGATGRSLTCEQEAGEKWLSPVWGLRYLRVNQAEVSSGVYDPARKQVAWTGGDRFEGHQIWG